MTVNCQHHGKVRRPTRSEDKRETRRLKRSRPDDTSLREHAKTHSLGAAWPERKKTA